MFVPTKIVAQVDSQQLIAFHYLQEFVVLVIVTAVVVVVQANIHHAFCP
jgi:hypothetical protein